MFIAREISFAADNLLCALLRLDPARRVQILDSCGTRGAEDDSRYLIAGFDPFETIEVRGAALRIEKRDGSVFTQTSDDVLGVLDERLAAQRIPPTEDARLPAYGACITTLSYDLAHNLERCLQRRATPRQGRVRDLPEQGPFSAQP
jgi:hypothetical protein